jgi:RimJ/RimL family protein N-acetyltransferase
MSTFKKIGSIVDNTNTSYSMYYANEVANTPALAYVFEGWTELLKNNMAFPRVHFGNKDSVVWIENDAGEIVALILYAIRKDEDDCWILLTYTVPSYRGRGINPKLLDVVKEIAKTKFEIKTISSNIFATNTSALKAIEKTGRKIIAYRTRLDI